MHSPSPSNCNRLDVLRTKHRAAASAAGMSTIVRNRGVRNESFACRANSGGLKFRAESTEQILLRFSIGETDQFFC